MKQRIRYVAIGAAAAMLACAAPLSLAAPLHTGIQGRSIAELHPTPIEIAPGIWVAPTGWASAPVATSVTVLSARSGRTVARFTTGGRAATYSVSLPPGQYVLVPDEVQLGPDCFVATGPVEVTVHPRQFTTRDIVYRTMDRCASSYFTIQGDPIP